MGDPNTTDSICRVQNEYHLLRVTHATHYYPPEPQDWEVGWENSFLTALDTIFMPDTHCLEDR